MAESIFKQMGGVIANALDQIKVDVDGLTASAWVIFTGSNGAIRASKNVSSVTRTAVGTWKVTFTNPMSSTAYAAVGQGHSGRTASGDGNDTTDELVTVGAKATTYCYLESKDIDNGAVTNDMPEVALICFGGN